MAKGSAKSASSSRVYVVAAIFFAFAMLSGMILFQSVYYPQVNNAAKSQTSNNAIFTIREELLSINRDVLMIITGIGDPAAAVKDVENSFKNIDSAMLDYEGIDYRSEKEYERYLMAKDNVVSLRAKINEYRYEIASLDVTEAKNVYTQEIQVYQQSALEMFDAVIDNHNSHSEMQQAKGRRVFYIALSTMFAILLVGEIAIGIIARNAKRAQAELDRKSKQAEAADRKFKHSQEKINDIAYTNFLTGLKNRYALENDIGEKLANEQMNIAVFDMDNFRSINDIYGYDFGDEYLVMIAEKLKNDFGEFAEIYNITGNEFCLIFNRDISDTHAMRYAENVFAALSSVFSIANIGIQLTVTGCRYHYLPGECANLNALLVKTDNIIRNAKRNGGNSLQNVMGL
ncbi:MAG: GGDEF domain-containing protein [Oscillospiraceae bacterium]|nr:GGDEF domain-containing protein [Oscillospiraceae bacterium]